MTEQVEHESRNQVAVFVIFRYGVLCGIWRYYYPTC